MHYENTCVCIIILAAQMTSHSSDHLSLSEDDVEVKSKLLPNDSLQANNYGTVP